MTTLTTVLLAAWTLCGAGAALSSFGHVGHARLQGLLHPDAEQNLFTAASSGALLAAAGLTGLLVVVRLLPAMSISFTAILGFLAFDEAFELHERVQSASGIGWTRLYVVVGVVVLLTGRTTLRALTRRARPLLLGTAVCWFFAFLLEELQWPEYGRHRLYDQMVYVEEMLEIGGSLLIILALMLSLSAGDGERRSDSSPLRSRVG
jgi:hypothetical protein